MLSKLSAHMAGMVNQMNMKNKTYSEAMSLRTYEERFEYLKLGGTVGVATFGFDRYLNQTLYRSPEWKRFRRNMVIRDNGCDMGFDGYEIQGKVLLHHINPLTIDDVLNRDPKIFDPENVICVSLDTHNAIHYGDKDLLITDPIIRTKNDTCPWRR